MGGLWGSFGPVLQKNFLAYDRSRASGDFVAFSRDIGAANARPERRERVLRVLGRGAEKASAVGRFRAAKAPAIRRLKRDFVGARQNRGRLADRLREFLGAFIRESAPAGLLGRHHHGFAFDDFEGHGFAADVDGVVAGREG